MPEDFIYVSDIVPDVQLDIRYYSSDNFVGAKVDGYEAPIAILSRPAATALKKASDQSMKQGYRLKIFDAYRPQMAVNHFIRWAADTTDIKTRAIYYPNMDKEHLFSKGYIASRSSHSRGSTIDLTLIDHKTGKEVDMGSRFDFFDPVSHHDAATLTHEQIINRETLKTIMQAQGFKTYPWEWWHYTLENEPFPDHYFNFPIR